MAGCRGQHTNALSHSLTVNYLLGAKENITRYKMDI
jgi:hypothetical protein